MSVVLQPAVAKPLQWRGGLTIPTQLLSPSSLRETVWTVRFATSSKRGSQLSQDAPVQICIIGQQGHAVLHEIQPLWDAEQANQDLYDICQRLGLGADHAASTLQALAGLGLTGSTPRRGAGTVRRFQEGSQDTVSFLGADVGPVASLMIAPQAGTWGLDEVTVSSSRDRRERPTDRGSMDAVAALSYMINCKLHSDRFLCRDKLGGSKFTGAAFLKPVPEDCVVYGTGEHALVLTKEQARLLHMTSLAGYKRLKTSLLATTVSLVATGSALLWCLDGSSSAGPFALGGAAGLGYQWLLQKRVDAVGLGLGPPKVRPGRTMQRLISSGPLRILLAALMAVVTLYTLEQASFNLASLPLPASQSQGAHLAWVTAGFLVQQMAVVGLASHPIAPPASRVLDNKR